MPSLGLVGHEHSPTHVYDVPDSQQYVRAFQHPLWKSHSPDLPFIFFAKILFAPIGIAILIKWNIK